jgi:hypothetical protein
MNIVLFSLHYFTWHYSRAFKDLLHTWANFFWFLIQFFSISLLLRTLFSPFKRIEDEQTHIGLENFFETLVMNVVSRIVGAIARLSILLIGLILLTAWCIALVGLLIFWVFAPAILLGMFIYGLVLLFI